MLDDKVFFLNKMCKIDISIEEDGFKLEIHKDLKNDEVKFIWTEDNHVNQSVHIALKNITTDDLKQIEDAPDFDVDDISDHGGVWVGHMWDMLHEILWAQDIPW